jgi:hypothetical protein
MRQPLALLLFLASAITALDAREQWTQAEAAAWYARQPWMAGANYLPRSAINQLEMWQAETFDARMIDEEFGWAEGLGFNVMRVFLHDLLWQQDPQGFLARFEQVLAIADRHHLRIMPVFFDSCWQPAPRLGRQQDPRPFTHNSGWVQSPGAEVMKDPARVAALKDYVVGVVGRFRADQRIVLWDLYNELDNGGCPKPYRHLELPDIEKKEKALALATQTREWALSAEPSQPVSVCIWMNHTKPFDQLSPAERFQITSGDVITFHSYSNLDGTRAAVEALRRYGRPLLCSEYMARPTGSTFASIMPYFKAEKIAAINWGFVDGKSQTKFPWDSWDRTYTGDPDPWFHDVLRSDGTPYNAEEARLIRELTGGR